MSIKNNPINRIKPQLLREQKTEALLVFIRTTIERYFIDLDETNKYLNIGTDEDSYIINETLQTLLSKLEESVVNRNYLNEITQAATKSNQMMLIAKKEEPLMVYYNAIMKQQAISLLHGEDWIPEQLIICLLSEWVLEEEKSVLLYPFLKEFDYTAILSRYDNVIAQAKKNEEWQKIASIKNMYHVSHEIIVKLINTNFKVNTKRVSKTRKKK